MKSLIETIVKGIVNKPVEVSVAEIRGDKTTIYELKVSTEDLGKVIGRQGRTARAIRSILSSGTRKANTRAVLEILE